MLLGISLIAIVAMGWNRSRAKGIKINTEPAQKELSLDSSALEKSKNADYELRIAQQREMIEAFKSGKPIDPDKLAELDPRRQHDLYDPIDRKNKMLDDSAEKSLRQQSEIGPDGKPLALKASVAANPHDAQLPGTPAQAGNAQLPGSTGGVASVIAGKVVNGKQQKVVGKKGLPRSFPATVLHPSHLAPFRKYHPRLVVYRQPCQTFLQRLPFSLLLPSLIR